MIPASLQVSAGGVSTDGAKQRSSGQDKDAADISKVCTDRRYHSGCTHILVSDVCETGIRAMDCVPIGLIV